MWENIGMRIPFFMVMACALLTACASKVTYQPAGERLAGRETITSSELGQNLSSGGRGDEGITGIESYPGSGSFVN